MELRASHILVDTKEEAADLKTQIEGGLSFEDAAKTHSKCPSGQNGGDLSWFSPDRMVAPFSDACMKMNEGDLSDPVQTQFGYHLIKLTGKK